MKNEINAVLENMTAATPEPEDYTGEDGLTVLRQMPQAERSLILRRTRPLSLAVTATRQSATAESRP